VLLSLGCSQNPPATVQPPSPASASGVQALIEMAQKDLARRLSVSVTQISLVEATEVEWSDSSLDCPIEACGQDVALVDGPGITTLGIRILKTWHHSRSFLEYSNGLVSVGSGRHRNSINLTYSGEVAVIGENPKLVFNRYGDQHFLSEFSTGSSYATRRFPVSRLEKEYLRGLANQTAGSAMKRDVVVLAAALSR
jgi:hypothetical protein